MPQIRGFGETRHATRLPYVEPVYGTVIQLARMLWRFQGLTFTVTGAPESPGCPHTWFRMVPGSSPGPQVTPQE